MVRKIGLHQVRVGDLSPGDEFYHYGEWLEVVGVNGGNILTKKPDGSSRVISKDKTTSLYRKGEKK